MSQEESLSFFLGNARFVLLRYLRTIGCSYPLCPHIRKDRQAWGAVPSWRRGHSNAYARLAKHRLFLRKGLSDERIKPRTDLRSVAYRRVCGVSQHVKGCRRREVPVLAFQISWEARERLSRTVTGAPPVASGRMARPLDGWAFDWSKRRPCCLFTLSTLCSRTCLTRSLSLLRRHCRELLDQSAMTTGCHFVRGSGVCDSVRAQLRLVTATAVQLTCRKSARVCCTCAGISDRC